MSGETFLLPITFLIACTLIWWWPNIRIALRLPRYRSRIATDADVGLSQIALPPSWSQTASLGGHAALQAVDRFHCRYVLVTAESLEDFDETVDLLEYSQVVVGVHMQSLEVSQLSGPIERAVASFAAVQYEYSARVHGQKITYLHTIVAGRRAFHQVVGWSASSSFSRPAFESVLDGFDERPGPVPKRDPGPTLQPESTSRYTVH